MSDTLSDEQIVELVKDAEASRGIYFGRSVLVTAALRELQQHRLKAQEPPAPATSAPTVEQVIAEIDKFSEAFDRRFWRVINHLPAEESYISRDEAKDWIERMAGLRSAVLALYASPTRQPQTARRRYSDEELADIHAEQSAQAPPAPRDWEQETP
jgi:hypothetical protein